MEWSAHKTKLPQQIVGGEIKKVARAGKPPVVVPVIVILIHVEVPLIVVPVEDRVCAKQHLCHHPLNTLRIESDSISYISYYHAPSIFIF